MLSLEMKYTALYWAMGFEEDEEDIFIKYYDNKYKIIIFAEKAYIDYGDKIYIDNSHIASISEHEDLVILECVNRLLDRGVNPEEILITKEIGEPNIIYRDIAIFCEAWQKYNDDFSYNKYLYNVKYTSLLASGIIDVKNVIIKNNEKYCHGLFEDYSDFYNPNLMSKYFIEADDDFIINNNELIKYNGKSEKVIVPEGIETLSANCFWNNQYVKEIVLPSSLKILGGDSFYFCKNLRKINIPKNVFLIGNNPFAACNNLEIIENESINFILIDRVLYTKDMTRIIYYPMNKKDESYNILDNTKYIGKHSFYNNIYLKKINVPNSVLHFENNPFSDCINLSDVVFNTKSYFNDKGVIYNRFMTMIVSVLQNADLENYVIPESVKYIGRNSFWNCKNIKNLTISKNIIKIGYNPFAGCSNINIFSDNPRFVIEDGMLLNEARDELICCPNNAAKTLKEIPKTITKLNARAFSCCSDLKDIILHEGIKLIDKSVFTLCSNIEKIYVPDSVEYINEWAFAGTDKLKEISISKNTILHKNALVGCNADIIIRDN